MREEISRSIRTLPIREQSQRLDNAYQILQNTQQSKKYKKLSLINTIHR